MTAHPNLRTAMDALERRKKAAGVGTGEWLETAQAVGILSGTDLTVAELTDAVQGPAMWTIPYAVSMGLANAGGAMWIDGLLTGLELAEQRRRAAAELERAREDERADVEEATLRLRNHLLSARSVMAYALQHMPLVGARTASRALADEVARLDRVLRP